MRFGPDETSQVRANLRDDGFASTTKKYVVYYDGPVASDVTFCGVSQAPPGNVGNTYSFVLLGLSPAACGTVGQNDYSALTTAHETIHNLGAVPFGAPHRCPDTAHICGDPYDIMSTGGGGEAYDSLAGARLDPGSDDYFGHSGSWWDVKDSLWLGPSTPTQAAGSPTTTQTGGSSPPTASKQHLVVGSVTATPARPRQGRSIRLTLQSTWDGQGRPQLRCRATLNHKTLPLVTSRWQPRISCTWTLPKHSAGRTFRAEIGGRVDNGRWHTRIVQLRVAA